MENFTIELETVKQGIKSDLKAKMSMISDTKKPMHVFSSRLNTGKKQEL